MIPISIVSNNIIFLRIINFLKENQSSLFDYKGSPFSEIFKIFYVKNIVFLSEKMILFFLVEKKEFCIFAFNCIINNIGAKNSQRVRSFGLCPQKKIV
jgi:hypothetical protein